MFPGAVKSMNRGRTKGDRSFASQRGGHTRNIAGKGSKHAPPTGRRAPGWAILLDLCQCELRTIGKTALWNDFCVL